jgi:glycosyltransferase involved in cell wall biosynthesis
VLHQPAPSAQGTAYRIERRDVRYHSLFCSVIWPLHPGHSGGEIRDFHLLRHLLSLSRVKFYSLFGAPADEREDLLAPHLDALYTAEGVQACRNHLVDVRALHLSRTGRLFRWLRQRGWPVLGPRYHYDATALLPALRGYLRAALQEDLDREEPQFLFVGPQQNAMGMLLPRVGSTTRLVMASYDVEAVRLRRLADSQSGWLARAAGRLEAVRARRFEADNLAAYDGIIAVSELDKQLFVDLYDFPPERVLVVPNGVDPEYFAFTERKSKAGKAVLFTGSLNYLPNHQAALRLIDRVMPLVRRHHPDASVWVVGQNPPEDVLARNDGNRTLVTGRVDDVRPYLASASVACVPLLAGSGTKYKVLEALCAGVPLVCSPLAAEGLDLVDGQDLVVGQTDEEVAAALVRFLSDRDAAGSFARAGRKKVESLYSWDRNLSGLGGWLKALADLPRLRDDQGRLVFRRRVKARFPALRHAA